MTDDSKKTKADSDWREKLYTPERYAKYASGEIKLRDLHAISGPEMIYIAEMGYNLFQQGRYKDAKVIYDGLIALDPEIWYFHAALGAIQLEAKEAGLTDEEFSLDAALASLNRSLELNPQDIASCVNRAEVYLYQAKIIEAVNDLKAAVEMDPDGTNEQGIRARRLAQEMLNTIEQETAATD
ncbi:MAG: type III secretion protein [Cystobacterineae bacterium]|nr:type III secretion protein [Cystobacterineae bacterium]